MRLRISSGIYGGRFIEAPQTDLTRPTTGRVKESVFNYLRNKIDFEDITAMDIYAGSGQLGLEILSHGAAHVTFIDKNYAPFQVLKKNVESICSKDQYTLIKIAAVQYLKTLQPESFDLILADPPFFSYDIYDVWKIIIENKLLKQGGFFVIERSIQTFDKDIEGFGIEPIRRMGDTCIYEFIQS